MNNNELSKRVAELMGHEVLELHPVKQAIINPSVAIDEDKYCNCTLFNIETAEAQMAFIKWWLADNPENRDFSWEHGQSLFWQRHSGQYTMNVIAEGDNPLEAIRAVVEAMNE